MSAVARTTTSAKQSKSFFSWFIVSVIQRVLGRIREPGKTPWRVIRRRKRKVPLRYPSENKLSIKHETVAVPTPFSFFDTAQVVIGGRRSALCPSSSYLISGSRTQGHCSTGDTDRSGDSRVLDQREGG